MARSDVGLGLNEVAALDPLEKHKMEDDQRTTRIPQFSFGFRRTLHAPSTKKDTAQSAPNSKEASPTLSRSKSLRLPRSPYSLKSHSSSALDQERDRGTNYHHQRQASQEQEVYPEPHVSYLKPRSSSGSSSNPSSRGSSPGTSLISHGHHNSQTEYHAMSQEYADSPRSTSSSPGLQKRSQSFSSRQRYQGNAHHPRTGSVNARDKNMVRPSNRSKTPTASTTYR